MNSVSPLLWWRLELPITDELEESLLWKLTDLGLYRVALQHLPERPAERTLLAWLPSSEWSDSDREQLVVSLRPLAETFGLTLASPIWCQVADEDWSLSWKKHWQPDPVGQHLLILPAWLDVPQEHSDRLVLRIDPGSAFGTGSHPTTRLCLEALERHPPQGLMVADLGCGSGVLGLAAIGLGARQVVAADTDSLAVSASRENAALNGLNSEHLRVALGSVDVLESLLQGEVADLLLCNILAPVIEALAPSFDRLLSFKGRALLSGLLVDQAPRLTAVLEALGWRVSHLTAQGRWGLLDVCRS
ncbi:MAG: 50S ribosomal protein L11 methyltransferase [Prochlorococcus sp.]|jgi:ribosomal protein L11 methyltransferase|nr:50S ribosomal protein L11 methyltransferase [Prochlorococcaceae cyanobacterium ETNP2_MAG_10]MDP6202932.1 50S ribosomal protein L11 methyltransferase [Prochlorococcaceae cyanobacterium ETNP18_MAG_14]MDP6309544.1 50S ribosomal protein L11 methyltransferase [Prochlorococcaceae cyanobacterium ETNP14_MAG_4]HJM80996.1 50S ribosomal protein L11 methyltransferase [Prochlorococcaceae cyanobacterium Fu_MAG_72]|tara:strand:- start:1437 stop:2345 length:909 start_codon:yes stop_codon:yes gene_type:complete